MYMGGFSNHCSELEEPQTKNVLLPHVINASLEPKSAKTEVHTVVQFKSIRGPFIWASLKSPASLNFEKSEDTVGPSAEWKCGH
jgi:hypothetical protein